MPVAEPAGEVWTRISGKRRALAGAVLALSNFMVILDLTIANVSVPHIAGNLGVTLDQGTWILTSYAVAEAICVPLTGWLAMRFGAVRVFLISMLGFGLFSMLCGLSISLQMIVACRVGQGLFGGPIMPISQTLMIRVFPPDKRAMAMALWAMTVTLGPALGPIFGGVISDNISWHWIFLINIPIAAACTFVGFLLLTPVETDRVRLPVDWIGLALLIFWIGCLQIVLDLGRERDWFADPFILTLTILSVIGFLVFLIWELTDPHPVVDLRVFRHRGYSALLVAQALAFGAFFASIVVVPQWLQTMLGYSATKAGVVTAMHAFAAMLCAPIVARNMGRVDPRLMMSAGVAWIGVMSLARMHWTAQADFIALIWPMFFQGIGMALMMIPLTTLALTSVDPEETASAAGLQNFTRTMSTAIAASVVLTLWGDSRVDARSTMVGAVHPDGLLAQLAAAGFTPDQARMLLSNLVDGEATTVAVDHTFFVSALVLFLGAAVVWIAPRADPGRMAKGPMGGH